MSPIFVITLGDALAVVFGVLVLAALFVAYLLDRKKKGPQP